MKSPSKNSRAYRRALLWATGSRCGIDKDSYLHRGIDAWLKNRDILLEPPSGSAPQAPTRGRVLNLEPKPAGEPPCPSSVKRPSP